MVTSVWKVVSKCQLVRSYSCYVNNERIVSKSEN
jgi:hypothetical protein